MIADQKRKYVEIKLSLDDFEELRETFRYAARRDTDMKLYTRLLHVLGETLHGNPSIIPLRVVGDKHSARTLQRQLLTAEQRVLDAAEGSADYLRELTKKKILTEDEWGAPDFELQEAVKELRALKRKAKKVA